MYIQHLAGRKVQESRSRKNPRTYQFYSLKTNKTKLVIVTRAEIIYNNTYQRIEERSTIQDMNAIRYKTDTNSCSYSSSMTKYIKC